jgi:hypothetical protein
MMATARAQDLEEALDGVKPQGLSPRWKQEWRRQG